MALSFAAVHSSHDYIHTSHVRSAIQAEPRSDAHQRICAICSCSVDTHVGIALECLYIALVLDQVCIRVSLIGFIRALGILFLVALL
ncbi:hypothetical protein BCCGELA001_03035 [Bradyrhizobium sp. CCGE-LA001]|nr:hypothetical protein BCCGELA001_03035 [Bradyrhizobium sp. CCGE-LA001]